jgi:hypothetical protein
MYHIYMAAYLEALLSEQILSQFLAVYHLDLYRRLQGNSDKTFLFFKGAQLADSVQSLLRELELGTQDTDATLAEIYGQIENPDSPIARVRL